MNWLQSRIDDFIRSVRDDPKRKPIAVGDQNNPTYWRWFVIPRNRFINVYLHNFLKDDEEHLHDHRAANISFRLQGCYFEERFVCRPQPGQPLPPTIRRFQRHHSLTFRLPSTPHRVVLLRDDEGQPIPCWSMFIKFPDVREWGFWCPGLRGRFSSWRHWTKYAAVADPNHPYYGKPGARCDD